MHFKAVKKSRTRSGFVIYSYFKDRAFAAVKKGCKNCKLQSVTKWVETLRPKWTFWRFPDFKRGKDSFSSPIPSIQCCATVRATFRKQETSQLWMEGTGEGCGFLCSLKLPYLSTMSQQFCRRLWVCQKNTICHLEGIWNGYLFCHKWYSI